MAASALRPADSDGDQRGERGEERDDATVSALFPGRDALIRLVGAVLAEQHGERTEMRRYTGLGILAKSRLTTAGATAAEELRLTAVTA